MEDKKVKKQSKLSRPQSLGEEIGNAITHGLGFVAGLVGMIFLLAKSNTALEYLSSVIFGVGMMMLYLSSCLYHAFRYGTTVKRIFKRFDHLSIYLLIGGTFAPILLCAVEQPKGIIFFIIQWCLIALGVVLKSINTQKYHLLHMLFYLGIGWSGLFFMGELLQSSVYLFSMILIGGVTYSVGIIFYATNFKYSHFIWHFFCLGGTIVQFLAIYNYIL